MSSFSLLLFMTSTQSDVQWKEGPADASYDIKADFSLEVPFYSADIFQSF